MYKQSTTFNSLPYGECDITRTFVGPGEPFRVYDQDVRVLPDFKTSTEFEGSLYHRRPGPRDEH